MVKAVEAVMLTISPLSQAHSSTSTSSSPPTMRRAIQR